MSQTFLPTQMHLVGLASVDETVLVSLENVGYNSMILEKKRDEWLELQLLSMNTDE